MDTRNHRNLDTLTDGIVRRIMRIAGVISVLTIASRLLLPKPIDFLSLVIAVIATTLVILVTFVPVRFKVLRHFYPLSLVTVGLLLTLTLGPQPSSILLLAGGLFVGSLVLSSRSLWMLAGITMLLMCVIGLWNSRLLDPDMTEIWSSAISSMLAVIVPAAIAGRMLVDALSRSLDDRSELLANLTQESSQLKNTITELETARTQLTQAQKLELIGQMAGSIAHDMNNALTGVMGEASMLDDTNADARERILESAAYAAQLTRQLMVFTRKDANKHVPIDLVKTVADMTSSLRRLLPSDMKMEFELPREPLVIRGDATQLLQVMMNLIANARDAMVAGGKIKIGVSRHPSAKLAMLSVEDSGKGIPADVLPKIFEPFFTTKAVGQGTGLGLVSVKLLVEGMSGIIKVASSGSGTSFVMQFPLLDASVKLASKPLARSTHGGGTVLVVDDDVRVRAVVYTTLARNSYQVMEAGSVDGVSQLLATLNEPIDLVITDVVMPNGGGEAVIRLVREKLPGIPVLVISSYADDEALRRGIVIGDVPFIAKPFTSSQLLTAVQDAISGK